MHEQRQKEKREWMQTLTQFKEDSQQVMPKDSSDNESLVDSDYSIENDHNQCINGSKLDQGSNRKPLKTSPWQQKEKNLLFPKIKLPRQIIKTSSNSSQNITFYQPKQPRSINQSQLQSSTNTSHQFRPDYSFDDVQFHG